MISTPSTMTAAIPVADIPQVEDDLALAHTPVKKEPAPRTAGFVVEVIGKIIEMSQRLFPGPVSIDYSYDPENHSDQYLIFDVVADGEYADYRDRELEWHEEVRRIIPGSLGEFTLSVTPRR